MSELPKGWIETTLDDACAKISDGTHHSPKEQYDEPAEGLYKYITAKNIRMAGLDLGNLTYVPEKIHREIYNRCNPELGDVLLTKDGVNTGDVAINTLEEEFSLLSSVALLKPHRELLDPKYLRYYIESPQGTTRLTGEMRGAAIRRIILRSIKAASVPIAPLPEQHRIVARIEELFSRLDAGVAALRHAKAQLQRYRQSVLAAAVTGQLTQAWREQHPDTEPAEELLKRILKQRREQWDGRGKYSEPASPKPLTFDLPSRSWARVSLDQLAVDTTIGLVRAAVLQNSSEEGFAYLKMDKIDMNGRVNLDGLVYVDATKDEVKRFSLRKGDVLFNTRNSVELVGKTGRVASEPVTPLVFNNNLMRLRFVDSALPAFVALQMCSKQFRDRMEGAKRATTSIAAVYGKDLRPLPIALPPLAEQHQIVAEVEARTTAIDHLEAELDRQISRSNRLRQSTLHEAFKRGLI